MTKRTFDTMMDASRFMEPHYRAGRISTWSARNVFGKLMVAYRIEGRDWMDLIVNDPLLG